MVVALRAASGHYRHTDYLVGFATVFGGLCFFLFYPAEFQIDFFPLETLVLFLLGSAFSAFLPPLRPLLTSRKLMDRAVGTAARAAFVELGISRTTRRTGVLAFVSILERRVEVITDDGINEEALGPAWKGALERLASTLQGDIHLERFIEALSAFGPILEGALPRAEDDENELPDEVHIA